MILLIDNYDSFSYNLYQLLGEIEPDIRVERNDGIDIAGIESASPSHIVISPGPGRPREAGISEEAVRVFAGRIPILGVCLGHQAICEVYGATVTYASELMHGKASRIKLEPCPLFDGLPAEIDAARYHSLAADIKTMPPELEVIARTTKNEVMAVRHRVHAVYGVQFHPESILTPSGRTILANFLTIGG
ncbi:MAG: aminodeoxychorismate/anthranilate synthase component II [Spirochaetaceae bacterium]|jgi:anthranilate synthase component 2|nr:aminodeoxychorismate/anthranilate synthase component II [Spirochaetaceae bacterium]